MAFLAVLSPYLLNSKRVFGHYFYNVNSTFYVWYDDWPAASQGTYQHGDGVGWPKMPASEIPSMGKYLREHSAGQIATRIKDGLTEMAVVSYNRLWYFKYVTLYLAFAAVLFASSGQGSGRGSQPNSRRWRVFSCSTGSPTCWPWPFTSPSRGRLCACC